MNLLNRSSRQRVSYRDFGSRSCPPPAQSARAAGTSCLTQRTTGSGRTFADACRAALAETKIRRAASGGQAVSWLTNWPRPRRLPWLLLISALVFVADRLSKTWVAAHIPMGGAIPIIPPRAADYALDQRGRGLFAFCRLGLAPRGALGLDRIHARRSAGRPDRSGANGQSHHAHYRRSGAHSWAGPSATCHDRIAYGSVVDFIEVHINLYHLSYHWPDFNLADSSIVIGACLLFLDSLRPHRNAVRG